MELNELENICEDFEIQMKEMHEHIVKDLDKIEHKKMSPGTREMLVDEEGNKVNLLEELLAV